MKTLKWANGGLVVDRNVGRPFYISGNRKAAQDVAHTLLRATDAQRQIGCGIKNFDRKYSHLLNDPTMVKMLVTQEVNQGIQRLMSWQQTQTAFVSAGEHITGINEILVSNNDVTNIVFYVSVRVETEDILQYAYRVTLRHQYPLNDPGLPYTDDNRP